MHFHFKYEVDILRKIDRLAVFTKWYYTGMLFHFYMRNLDLAETVDLDFGLIHQNTYSYVTTA